MNIIKKKIDNVLERWILPQEVNKRNKENMGKQDEGRATEVLEIMEKGI